MWAETVKREDWASRVAEALRRYFQSGGWLFEAAVLLDVWTEQGEDGVGVLCAVYEHPFWPERTGLRRRLDRPPAIGSDPDEDLAQWFSSWIATFEISQPLGRMHDLLVEDDDGVHWWGDGYRELSEHPDFAGDMEGWRARQLSSQRVPHDEEK